MRESDQAKYRQEIYKKYTTPDTSGNLPRGNYAFALMASQPHSGQAMLLAKRITDERRRLRGTQSSGSSAQQQAQQAAMSLERAAAFRRQMGFGSSQFSAGSNAGMRLS